MLRTPVHDIRNFECHNNEFSFFSNNVPLKAMMMANVSVLNEGGAIGTGFGKPSNDNFMTHYKYVLLVVREKVLRSHFFKDHRGEPILLKIQQMKT